jgi:hypothetical protein
VSITPLDVGRNVAASCQMLVRVKEWYAKATALGTYFDKSALPVFRDDDNGGFSVISGLSKRGGEGIDTLLAGQMGCILQAMVAFSEASRIMREWRNMSHSLAKMTLKKLVQHVTARHYRTGFILQPRSVHTSSNERIFDTCKRGCVCRGRRLKFTTA